MGLFWQKTVFSKKANCYVWLIEESLVELQKSLLPLDLQEFHQIKLLKKKYEYAATRILLYYIAKQEKWNYQGIEKNATGKPYLKNIPLEITISHAYPLVAVATSPSSLGIDVEKVQSKIAHVAPRVFTLQEMQATQNDLSLLTQLWTAKEAIYKAYSYKELNFKENITCEFCYKKQQFCKGIIRKGSLQKTYILEHHWLNKQYHLSLASPF